MALSTEYSKRCILETKFISRMARRTATGSTGKGERANGRKHLNASLPRQLVFDFNKVAEKQGHGRRDALVEELVRRFLEKAAPDCDALRDEPSRTLPDIPVSRLSKREGFAVRHRIEEQRAIRAAREYALEILSATEGFVTRKGPQKRSPARRSRKEKAS